VKQRLIVSIEIEPLGLLLNVMTGDFGSMSKMIRKLEDSSVYESRTFGDA
jgi:hypothetical protein